MTGRETLYLKMDHLMLLLLFLWNSGLQAEEEHKPTESVRLVGGRCAGIMELKHEGEWRPVHDFDMTLKMAVAACQELDCGSAVSVRERRGSSEIPMWSIKSDCVHSGSALSECATAQSFSILLDVTCLDSVRLVAGTSLCSGRLEVRSNQSTQSWSSVCEADFDLQDAQVVCRELGCGAPSVLQGTLYGGAEAPMWIKEFQCEGHESALLDCRSSERNTCSAGRAAGLTCSEPVRLVGGDSRCAGTLEVNQGEWRQVSDVYSLWTLREAAAACKELDCGTAVSFRQREQSSVRSLWKIVTDCVHTGSSLRECATSYPSTIILYLTCSDSVRLVAGTSLCSGRLEVRSNQSTQSWSSVCEADFDLQDAQVVCRELGCGAPSVLQGTLYGRAEAPMWIKEFQCEGHESALLDCRSSERNTCSAGRAAGLTCSEPVRLVGGDSRCAGTLQVNRGEWRPVTDNEITEWSWEKAAFACRELNCGSVVSVKLRGDSIIRTVATWGSWLWNGMAEPVWWIRPNCVLSGFALRECATSDSSVNIWNLICSDLLLQPNISVSSSMDGVSEAQQHGFQLSRGSTFNISCSIQPQYPGGSFHLSFTSSNSTHNYTQPAVNHSANFLFPAAEPAHQGTYSCIYRVSVFSHDFSSDSHLLSVTVSSPDPTPFIIRAVVLPLILLLENTVLYFYCKARRRQKVGRRENSELDYYNLGVSAAAGEGAQGAE